MVHGQPRSILITGASSGIGEALADALAAPGTTLFLGGRNVDRLTAVADRCTATGASVHPRQIDVRDQQAVDDWICEADDLAPLDLVIANAGISAGSEHHPGSTNSFREDRSSTPQEWERQTRDIFAVNTDGVLNTVLPAARRMRMRHHGQIAIVASIAGFRGFSSAPAYCGSKAAVKVWGEGLRGVLARDQVRLSVILPGFVESRITAANTFPMPLLMTAPRAAGIILRGLARNQGRIAFPWPTVFAAWLGASLPNVISEWIGRRLPDKE